MPFNLCPSVDIAQLVVLGHFLHHASVLYVQDVGGIQLNRLPSTTQCVCYNDGMVWQFNGMVAKTTLHLSLDILKTQFTIPASIAMHRE